MSETRGITFHETDTPGEFAAKLNRLVLWLTTDPKFEELRVGDEAKWEHDGKATVTALKMATGAAADKVLTSDADGDATWQDAQGGEPGGSSGHVQFNNAGEFGGEARFGWNFLDKRLIVPDIRAYDSNGLLLANDNASGYLFVADNGNVGIKCDPGAADLDIDGDCIRLRDGVAPLSASDSGRAGEIRWGGNYLYLCHATDTWIRFTGASW